MSEAFNCILVLILCGFTIFVAPEIQNERHNRHHYIERPVDLG
jgi:hypothetical protein